MATPTPTKPGVQISAGGLIIGILLGAFYLLLAEGARIALGEVQTIAQGSGSGATITSNVFSFMTSNYFLPLVVALIVVKIAHRTIKEPHTIKGPLKVVLGALSGVFYYLILGGGMILLTVGLASSYTGTISVSITLLVTLLLLEASAGLQALQGIFEYRDAKNAHYTIPAPTGETPANPRRGNPVAQPVQFC